MLFAPSEKGSTPLGNQFFPLTVDPFSEGILCAGKQKVTEVVSRSATNCHNIFKDKNFIIFYLSLTFDISIISVFNST